MSIFLSARPNITAHDSIAHDVDSSSLVPKNLQLAICRGDRNNLLPKQAGWLSVMTYQHNLLPEQSDWCDNMPIHFIISESVQTLLLMRRVKNWSGIETPVYVPHR